jgi:predicted Zn-dependent protease
MGDSNPIVQTRLAQARLESGDARGALDALESARRSYPTYVTTWLIMGKAAATLGEHGKAREYLDEAARINPFDPEIHGLLAATHKELGDADEATRSRERAALVR